MKEIGAERGIRQQAKYQITGAFSHKLEIDVHSNSSNCFNELLFINKTS